MHLIGAGQVYDRLISVGGITTSTDGITWTDVISPLAPRNRIHCMATNGTVHVAASDTGLVGVTTDLQTWWTSRLLNGNFSPRRISFGANGSRPVFAAAGQRKYDPPSQLAEEYLPGDEVAEVLVMEPSNRTQWLLAFTNPYPNSCFHSIRWFDNITIGGIRTSAWVAVGSRDLNPEIWYSLGVDFRIDNDAPDPNTWQQVQIPAAFDGRPLYDVCQVNDGSLWFAGLGFVTRVQDIGIPTWTGTDEFTGIVKGNDYSSIAANPTGDLVAVSSSRISSTSDYVSWNHFSYPGYQFRSVIWFNYQWIVGASSDLTDKTYFTSSDGRSWTPRNNAVQMYSTCAY